MPQVQQILDGKKIDSFPVRVTCIETRSQGKQINDHQLLKALASSSKKKSKAILTWQIATPSIDFSWEICQGKRIKLNLSSALVHRLITVQRHQSEQ